MASPAAFVARAREVLADSTIGDLERGRFAVKVLPALLDVAEAADALLIETERDVPPSLGACAHLRAALSTPAPAPSAKEGRT